MKLSDLVSRLALTLLAVAAVLVVFELAQGGTHALAAAVVGGLMASVGPEIVKLAARAHLVPAPPDEDENSVIETRYSFAGEGEKRATTTATYMRIPVENFGPATALGAQAYLTGVAWRNADSASWEQIGAKEPIALEWGGLGSVRANIPQGVTHYINVVRVVKHPWPQGNTLEVCGPYVPFSLSDPLNRLGEFRLRVSATAENAKTVVRTLAFAWPGETSNIRWNDAQS